MPSPDPVELLIVDDDPILRIDLADRLRRRGFAVFRAANADQAMKIMEHYPTIRAVLSDMEMPAQWTASSSCTRYSAAGLTAEAS